MCEDFTNAIAPFYRGQSIFITGGTGFLGKVLVEKLLRSCPEISNIYLLMRPKNEKDIETRMKQLLDAKIFDWLRQKRPEALNKIIVIPGDITSPDLGIDPAHYEILTEKVSIVFHSAATVKFDEPLKGAFSMNVLGTKSLLQICHRMKKLQAVVHVSTAYCNCDRQFFDESLYPSPANLNKIIEYVNCLDEDHLNTITPNVIGNRPNTYTFTKAMAEHLFIEQSKDLPGAIVRPSIVAAAWEEPLPGWTDNLNGPTGLIAGAGKGVIRTFLCYKDFVVDIIPVDIVINLLISVAWYTATARPENVIIYQCTSGSVNPIKWKEIEKLGMDSIIKNPFNDVVWYPGGSFKNSRFVNHIYNFLLHKTPAAIMDTGSILAKKEPKMLRLQRKIEKAMAALEFFTTQEWRFSCKNVMTLYSQLSESDKQIFNFDVRQVNWQEYVDNYVEGVRLYILKEDPDSSQAAKNNIKRMYWLNKTVQSLMLFIPIGTISYWILESVTSDQ